METLPESKNRKCETKDGAKPKRKVLSDGTDTIAYLRMRLGLDAKLEKEEIRIKQAEVENRKAQQNSMSLQQEALTNSIIPTKTARAAFAANANSKCCINRSFAKHYKLRWDKTRTMFSCFCYVLYSHGVLQDGVLQSFI